MKKYLHPAYSPPQLRRDYPRIVSALAASAAPGGADLALAWLDPAAGAEGADGDASPAEACGGDGGPAKREGSEKEAGAAAELGDLLRRLPRPRAPEAQRVELACRVLQVGVVEVDGLRCIQYH